MEYNPSDWISLSEASRRNRISKLTIKRLIADEKLSVMTQTGKRFFVRADEVKAIAETWIKPRTQETH